MSDETIVVEQTEVNEVETLRQQLADAQKAIEALANKKDELLKETKAAKDEKRRQAEIAEQAKRDQLSVAEKNGEFEKLYKQAQEEKQTLTQQLAQDRKERRDEKINGQAIRIANELAKGDAYKAELLSNFVANSLSKIADDYGTVDTDVVEGLKQQFEKDAKYAPLLGGSKAIGGSAPGNTRSAGNDTKQLSMDDYNKLTPMKQLEFAKQVQAGKAQII